MSLWRRAPAQPAPGRCRACRHFEADPRAIEAALPGLSAMSSAFASVRDDDGLCGLHDRFASPRGGCAGFCALQPEPIASA